MKNGIEFLNHLMEPKGEVIKSTVCNTHEGMLTFEYLYIPYESHSKDFHDIIKKVNTFNNNFDILIQLPIMYNCNSSGSEIRSNGIHDTYISSIPESKYYKVIFYMESLIRGVSVYRQAVLNDAINSTPALGILRGLRIGDKLNSNLTLVRSQHTHVGFKFLLKSSVIKPNTYIWVDFRALLKYSSNKLNKLLIIRRLS